MFRGLERWFENEPIGFVKTALYVCLFTVINCVWVLCAFFLLDYWGAMSSYAEESMVFVDLQDASMLLIMLFCAALIEELAFRAFPISVISVFSENKIIFSFLLLLFINFVLIFLPILWIADNYIFLAVPFFILAIIMCDRLKVTLAIIFASSILFAFAHGPNWWHLAFQGFSGFIFSICYLKCGGYNDWVMKPLLASTMVHCLSNAVFVLTSTWFI